MYLLYPYNLNFFVIEVALRTPICNLPLLCFEQKCEVEIRRRGHEFYRFYFRECDVQRKLIIEALL
jgi:hypothetical protein